MIPKSPITLNLHFYGPKVKRSPSDLLIPVEIIERWICLIRGHKVTLDSDLAKLYGVTTGNLKYGCPLC